MIFVDSNNTLFGCLSCFVIKGFFKKEINVLLIEKHKLMRSKTLYRIGCISRGCFNKDKKRKENVELKKSKV